MKKWHVNPENGEPSVCKSKFRRCPFADESEHFDSLEIARLAIEETYSSINHRSFAKIKRNLAVDETLYPGYFTAESRDESDQVSFRDGRKQHFRDSLARIPTELQRAMFIYWNEERSAHINGLLWGTMSPKEFDTGTLDEYKKTVRALDAYIANNTMSQDKVVFKGIELRTKLQRTAALKQLSELEPGDITTSPGFTSTSISHDVAKGFTGVSGGIILEIVESRGGYMDEYAEEIVLPRKAQFVYIGHKIDELSNNIYVQMKQV